MDMFSLLHFQIACHALILANIIFLKRKKIIVRRWWQRRELKDRDKIGAYKKIFLYYKRHDHEGFYKFVGMSVHKFNELHKLTRIKLQKYSYRRSLTSELRLSAVLNFLVHGGSVTKQSWFFLIGRSTMYQIIPEVCEAVCEALEGWISLPTGDELAKNAKEFYKLYDFPNVVGIIDGKHVSIKAPPKSGSWFRNFKQNYSINLMAACDALGRLIWVSVGDFGSKNDASNLANSSLGIALRKDEVNFPAGAIIPNTNVKCPFFFLADGGFALQKHVITPYRKTRSKPMPLKFQIFNIRLQHPRKTIERVFGILCKKWQVMNGKLDFKLKTTDLIIFTVVHLYNYTLDDKECDSSDNDSESSSDSRDNSTDDDDSNEDSSDEDLKNETSVTDEDCSSSIVSSASSLS